MSNGGLSVAILTCSDLGYETAAAVCEERCVSSVAVIRAPAPRRGSSWKRIRTHFRKHGLLRTVKRAAGSAMNRGSREFPAVPGDRSWALHEVDRFESPRGLAVFDSLAPDLAIVDGTYILPPAVFARPRLGTINLHCGYLPEFKGAPPAFWELFEGRTSVGVTVHFVTADLDGGPIVARRTFPLDPAPKADPMSYVEQLWRGVLRPAGIEMLCDTVVQAAGGSVSYTPQDPAVGHTYRSPRYADIKELRRRVAQRRRRDPDSA